MHRTTFSSRALPGTVRRQVHGRLHSAHAHQPFSTTDPRDTVRRVAQITHALGLRAVMYRGVVDLRGAEIDHVWLELEGRVIDAALPLHEVSFVELLRRFVAGDAEMDDLARAAAGLDVQARVVGEFPDPIRYLGRPVWSAGREGISG